MATANGYRYAEELVRVHGWAWDNTPMPDDFCGDQWVIDPITGKRMNPHEAREVQNTRTAREVTGEDQSGDETVSG